MFMFIRIELKSQLVEAKMFSQEQTLVEHNQGVCHNSKRRLKQSG